MKRALYHGSKDRIVKPLFGSGVDTLMPLAAALSVDVEALVERVV